MTAEKMKSTLAKSDGDDAVAPSSAGHPASIPCTMKPAQSNSPLKIITAERHPRL